MSSAILSVSIAIYECKRGPEELFWRGGVCDFVSLLPREGVGRRSSSSVGWEMPEEEPTKSVANQRDV
jgi:hypothetical protein